MNLSYKSNNYIKETDGIIKHLKQYVELIPNDKEEYKYLFYDTYKLIGTIKYNNYTILEFNGDIWYPASAKIEVQDNSKVFQRKWEYSYSIEQAIDQEKYYQRELKAGNKNIAWEHIK